MNLALLFVVLVVLSNLFRCCWEPKLSFNYQDVTLSSNFGDFCTSFCCSCCFVQSVPLLSVGSQSYHLIIKMLHCPQILVIFALFVVLVVLSNLFRCCWEPKLSFNYQDVTLSSNFGDFFFTSGIAVWYYFNKREYEGRNIKLV